MPTTPPRAELTFVGTATTVLRLGPFTLLTDPNFLHRGQFAYLGYGLFTRRRTEPAMQPAQLPELDAIVLSHLHGDHFDRIARRELSRDLPVFTTTHAARRLDRWGFGQAVGMTPWQQQVLDRDGFRLVITAAPGVHGPGLLARLLPPVMGSVLELHRGPDLLLRLYITGDTLLRPWLAEVPARLGPLDVLVAHLGGTRIAGLLVTMDAPMGADLLDLLRPGLTVPIHYDDYGVFKTPLPQFLQTVAARGGGHRVVAVGRGESTALPLRQSDRGR
ncbi:MBL fold metallo-hydrolase [Crossiella sp. NPDC003009]